MPGSTTTLPIGDNQDKLATVRANKRTARYNSNLLLPEYIINVGIRNV